MHIIKHVLSVSREMLWLYVQISFDEYELTIIQNRIYGEQI